MKLSFSIVLALLSGIVRSFYFSLVNLLKWVFPKRFEKSVAGDVVLVTGTTSGIGRLMALEMARRGATVVVVDRRGPNTEIVREIKELGGKKAFAFQCDLSKREEIYAMAERVKSECGTVTVLVNNAGVVNGRTILDSNDADIENTFKVNILSHFHTIKSFLPGMISQRKGHVVTISSIAGLNGCNKLADYCCTKFAGIGLDESLREELRVLGHSEYVKTTVVCPYYIGTDMFQGVQSKCIDILTPEEVTSLAIEGILTDQEVVLIPGWTKWLSIVKACVPANGWSLLADAIGANSTMDHFVGKDKKELPLKEHKGSLLVPHKKG